MSALPDQPEPCLSAHAQCYSRTACGAFGYCRERNMQLDAEAPAEKRQLWQAEAARRRASQLPADRVAFLERPSGREEAMLGSVMVAEIAPAAAPGRHTHAYRLLLPGAGGAFKPARDLELARWQVRRLVGEWLAAADLRPNGAR
jgi:hypothetical protein